MSRQQAKTFTSPRRLLAPLLLIGCAICFFFPFATVSCDESADGVKVTGIEIVTGTASSPDDADAEPDEPSFGEILTRLAGPGAALALGAAIIGAVIGLLVNGAAPLSGLVAGGVAAVGLGSLYLFGQDSGTSYHDAFWLAFALATMAAAFGAMLFARRDVSLTGRQAAGAVVALAGVVVLLAETVGRLAAKASLPTYEELYFWISPAAFFLPVGVIVGVLLLVRAPWQEVGAGLLVGSGAAALLHAGATAGRVAAEEDTSFDSRGLATIFVGGALILAGGLLTLRRARVRETIGPRGLAPAVVGVGFLVLGTFVPFDGGGVNAWEDPAQKLLPASDGLSAFMSLVPLGCAAIVVLAPLVLAWAGRLVVTGVWIAVGAVGGLFFVQFLYPLLTGGPDISFGPGALLGLIGGLLVVAGGGICVREAAPEHPSPVAAETPA